MTLNRPTDHLRLKPLRPRAVLVGVVAAALSLPLTTDVWAGSRIQETVRENCLGCHADSDGESNVDLSEIAETGALPSDLELLDRIRRVLQFREMPPPTEEPLEAAGHETFAASVSAKMSQIIDDENVLPHVPMRRMTRFQYANAVKDLFELNGVVFSLPENMMREYGDYFQPASKTMPEVVNVGSRPLGKSQLIEPRLAGVAPFPQDLRAEHGFDNQADHLSMSPLLMESFLALGRSVVSSPDFNPKRVGVWTSLFQPPKAEAQLESVVRVRLERFLTRAFRRPPSDDVVGRYAEHVMSLIGRDVSFVAAMKEVVAAALASPRFLYIYQGPQPTSEPERVSDWELASRLSFFFWGSGPDDTLLDAARAGHLQNDDVLAAQIDRMLNDRRTKRFCDSFPSQWLQLERIISAVPNRERFPDFYYLKYRTSMHMMLEPLLVFETVFIEDRPITELIDSSFSYRSNRLQTLYYDGGGRVKKNEVKAIAFHRTPVADRREGGVMTTPAVMSMTSGTERTKPITRGAWLATVIFHNPPQPPPADVPPLPETAALDDSLTLREQLAAHRERADCAGCHEKIDPLGFALESYGPTGKWRDVYENGREVDMAGVLFNTHSFADIAQFKDALLAEEDAFAHAFAGHLLAFALAREVEPSDQPTLRDIVAKAKRDDFRMRSLLKHVAMSRPFRFQSNPRIKPSRPVTALRNVQSNDEASR